MPIDDGWVRLRVLWTGLVASRFEGLDEGGSSDEHLTFQVWGAPPSPPTVVRWWSEWVLPPPSDLSPDGRRQVEGLEAVLDRLSRLRTLDRVTFPYPAMPGGGGTSSVYAVLFDSESETWWVDGSDIRRTLREITQEEAQDLVSRDPAPQRPSPSRALLATACGMEVHWVKGISVAEPGHWGHRRPAPHGEPVV